jgi:hypothetical protein
MRFARSALQILSAVAIAASTVAAQSGPPSAPAMGRDEITAFARIQAAIAEARDSLQAQFAKAGNAKEEAQQQLREQLHAQITEILQKNGMTEEEYRRKTYLVSTDSVARQMFDSALVAVTGQPIPGQYHAPPPRPAQGGAAAKVSVPPGPAGVHIGHVVNAFGDTPDGQGLLPTAMAEARIAAQHAQLAARDPANLDAMKLHAGHVIHAIDPTVITSGPGLGYGVKKAATGVATHIELAAKSPGASQNIMTHAVHIATSARNTVTRADQILALAQQVRAATSAADAAALVSQLVSLTSQLISGADANGDGRVSWEEGEGGLQQCQEHVDLMLAGEGQRP